MRLAELQAAYRGYLISGDSAALAPAIVADSFDGPERLAIYRNNFLISLGEALKANFPVTLQLLGKDFFEQAARRFVLAQPPRRPCLFEYGMGFADYLRDLPELATRPYIVDMARFEFARVAAYNAPVEPAVTPETLVGLSPEQLEALPIRRARHALVVGSPRSGAGALAGASGGGAGLRRHRHDSQIMRVAGLPAGTGADVSGARSIRLGVPVGGGD